MTTPSAPAHGESQSHYMDGFDDGMTPIPF